MQNLQQQLEVRTTDHERMQDLFNRLQNGSDQEATTLLATLRLGATIDELTGGSAGPSVPPMRYVYIVLALASVPRWSKQ
jgi:hypothetical protein